MHFKWYFNFSFFFKIIYDTGENIALETIQTNVYERLDLYVCSTWYHSGVILVACYNAVSVIDVGSILRRKYTTHYVFDMIFEVSK